MNDQQQTNYPERIISRAKFRELTGISRSSEWRLRQKGKLPTVVEVNGRKLGYPESAYNAWIKQYSA